MLAVPQAKTQNPTAKSVPERLRLYLAQFYSARKVTVELTTSLLGLVFAIAFFSLLPQLNALYGPEGLLPVESYFNEINAARLQWFDLPTLLWLKPDLIGLKIITIAGGIAGLLALAGKFKAPALFIAYLCYFSLVQVGQDFLSFQWDILLLEAGFAGIFLASRTTSASVRGLASWLFILIGFKLMLLSGLCKILSQDPTWQDQTALTYHFFTQPLPTPLAPFLQALPQSAQKLMCTITLMIELLAPFLVFFCRFSRHLAFLLFAALQLLIMASGNYGFFNWLALVLFLPLIDDKIIGVFARQYRLNAVSQRLLPATYWSKFAATIVGYLIVCNVLFMTGYAIDQPLVLRLLIAVPQRFYLVNSYGLFAVMTKSRPEIVIEGSRDGVHYRPYEFNFKPGNERRPPPVVAPFQPRLDWQLWFEALRATSAKSVRPSPWFLTLLTSLQNNDKAITSTLAHNPFGNKGPQYIRARIVNYRFATPGEILHDGIYWHSDFGASREIYFDSKTASHNNSQSD